MFVEHQLLHLHHTTACYVKTLGYLNRNKARHFGSTERFHSLHMYSSPQFCSLLNRGLKEHRNCKVSNHLNTRRNKWLVQDVKVRILQHHFQFFPYLFKAAGKYLTANSNNGKRNRPCSVSKAQPLRFAHWESAIPSTAVTTGKGAYEKILLIIFPLLPIFFLESVSTKQVAMDMSGRCQLQGKEPLKPVLNKGVTQSNLT